MKKILVILVALIDFGIAANAQQRIADNVYLQKNYNGSYSVFDKNRSVSINLTIQEVREGVFDIFCGNEYKKSIGKTSLNIVIASLIGGACSTFTGGTATPACVAAAAAISQYTQAIANNVYDDVCKWAGK